MIQWGDHDTVIMRQERGAREGSDCERIVAAWRDRCKEVAGGGCRAHCLPLEQEDPIETSVHQNNQVARTGLKMLKFLAHSELPSFGLRMAVVQSRPAKSPSLW